MALIRCPECGKEISDKAASCIHCGCPLDNAMQEESVVNVQPAASTNASLLSYVGNIFGQVMGTSKIYANKVKSHLVNFKTHPANVQRKIVVVGGITVICVIALLFGIISQTTLSSEEKYVLAVAKDYKSMLKDPDSMIIRGDILYIETDDFDRYVCFTASGNNSYGASVTSMPIYKGYSYLGRYDDKDDDEDLSSEDRLSLLKARVYVAGWNLMKSADTGREKVDLGGATGLGAATGTSIDGKKIAKKVKCQYADS